MFENRFEIQDVSMKSSYKVTILTLCIIVKAEEQLWGSSQLYQKWMKEIRLEDVCFYFITKRLCNFFGNEVQASLYQNDMCFLLLTSTEEHVHICLLCTCPLLLLRSFVLSLPQPLLPVYPPIRRSQHWLLCSSIFSLASLLSHLHLPSLSLPLMLFLLLSSLKLPPFAPPPTCHINEDEAIL